VHVVLAPVNGSDSHAEIGATLSVKLTVPPVGVGLTVAVSVMGEPTAAGFGDETIAVEVLAIAAP
jgi:hypothetical protein